MTPQRKRRLGLIVLMLIGVAGASALILRAFQENMMFYYSPRDIKAGRAPAQHEFRVGGLVVSGSLVRSQTDLSLAFTLTDLSETVQVHYQGILPDLFREGQGIVARGTLRADGTIQAIEVLAKHDENYMPPEVASSLHPPKVQP